MLHRVKSFAIVHRNKAEIGSRLADQKRANRRIEPWLTQL
jgi:hypothetical protein